MRTAWAAAVSRVTIEAMEIIRVGRRCDHEPEAALTSSPDAPEKTSMLYILSSKLYNLTQRIDRKRR